MAKNDWEKLYGAVMHLTPSEDIMGGVSMQCSERLRSASDTIFPTPEKMHDFPRWPNNVSSSSTAVLLTEHSRLRLGLSMLHLGGRLGICGFRFHIESTT